MNAYTIRIAVLAFILMSAGCASIQTPTGGKRDVTPPKLLSADPADSLLNTKASRIQLRFDEYITVNDVGKEFQISPILAIAPTAIATNKKVTVKIVDSLLEENTTYRISFGNSIRDLHEGNVFSKYTYTFSTGSYFDSLQMSGNVVMAATGLPDTGDVYVMLYYASRSDSAVVKEKPKYVTKTDKSGAFTLKGLPGRKFRIYAIKDANSNLIYDGPPDMIGFYDGIITPGDTGLKPITMKVFKEIDTLKGADTSTKLKMFSGSSKSSGKEGLTYEVPVDTNDNRKRTFDITLPINITFSRQTGAIAASRIHLDYDSLGNKAEAVVNVQLDSIKKNILHINTNWQENTLYTLRLQKGFAKDTAGADVMPSRHTFRTRRDEDYGKLQIHLPSKYYGRQYLLMVCREQDTVYQKPVLDTIVNLVRLRPGVYSFRIIVDKNENGKWDTGNFFDKIQPEDVIPYNSTQTLKAGWENIIDFEQKKKPRLGAEPGKNAPK